MQNEYLAGAEQSYKVLDLAHNADASPLVGEYRDIIWGYDFDKVSYTDDEGRDVGFTAGFTTDLSLKYQFVLYWLFREDTNFLVMNPNVGGEGAVHAFMGFKLYFMQLWFWVDFNMIEFSPLDYQGLWNMDDRGNYCRSLGAFMDVFDFKVRFEMHVNECVFGAFGFLLEPDDFLDCFWRYYRPVLPIFETSFLDQGDMEYDYVEWTCNFNRVRTPVIEYDE